MKKVLLMGLGAEATEAGVRTWLSSFGPVGNISFVREGDAKAPLALVEMDISDGQAFFLVSRISNYWHDGSLISARLMTH